MRVGFWLRMSLLGGFVFLVQIAGASGQQERRHWAFRPLVQPAVPLVKHEDRVRTPIDAFVLAGLEPRGLTLSPQAPRLALLRRVSFDLIGLPPATEETEAFLADPRPDAYERLIDRLLGSPHYGERWARHWLDAVGYVDTVGTDNDAGIIRVREGAWRYRDYVVRAFNADMPYDRFVTEQLAGDELDDWRHAPHFSPETLDRLIATGFLRTACDSTTENELNRPLERFQVLHGTVENVTSSLLGLTVACARCHDHKYDPIPQRDYYRFMAFFTPAYNPTSWIQPQNHALADVAPAEQAQIDRENAELDKQIAHLEQQRMALRQPYREKHLEAKLAQLPEPIRADTKAALGTEAEKRTPVQKYLVEKLGPLVKVTDDEVAQALSTQDRAKDDAIPGEMAALTARKRSYGKIQAIYESGSPPATRLLRRGNHETPGAEVAPGLLSALCAAPAEADIHPDLPHPGSSGRRTALARWLTKPGTPASALLARVLVNRVWQHHFGTGLVATPENFGATGSPPTHPELLEWLAADFVAHGWRIKRLHRLILTSAVYRQTSHRDGSQDPDPEKVDPGDALLWHWPMQRLDAECLRDAMLALSGQLDRTIGGPPVAIEAQPDGHVVLDAKHLPSPFARGRRSLYVLSRRHYGLTMLSVFDAPTMDSTCPRRVPSVVPLQALALLNSAFALDQAKGFAQKVIEVEPSDLSRQIELAFRQSLGRKPEPFELAAAEELYRTHLRLALKPNPKRDPREVQSVALTNVCLMLLNCNEFLYLE